MDAPAPCRGGGVMDAPAPCRGGGVMGDAPAPCRGGGVMGDPPAPCRGGGVMAGAEAPYMACDQGGQLGIVMLAESAKAQCEHQLQRRTAETVMTETTQKVRGS